MAAIWPLPARPVMPGNGPLHRGAPFLAHLSRVVLSRIFDATASPGFFPWSSRQLCSARPCVIIQCCNTVQNNHTIQKVSSVLKFSYKKNQVNPFYFFFPCMIIITRHEAGTKKVEIIKIGRNKKHHLVVRWSKR